MGIQNTPIRIPDVWDAAWYRTHIAEHLAKADVRNAVGVGVNVESDGNSFATLTVDAGTSIAPHNEDPFAHVAAFEAHKAESDPHPQYAASTVELPVGTVFLTIGNTNPGTLLGYGTWALRASGRTLLGA